MRFALAIVGLGLAGTLNAAALDVRAATESEFASALIGCWVREPTLRTLELERKGYWNSFTICFGSDGKVETSAAGGNDTEIEGRGDLGTFEVADGKLRLRGSGDDAWVSRLAALECDVIMSLGHAMKLTNCIGLGEDAGEAIADSSYEFRND